MRIRAALIQGEMNEGVILHRRDGKKMSDVV